MYQTEKVSQAPVAHHCRLLAR